MADEIPMHERSENIALVRNVISALCLVEKLLRKIDRRLRPGFFNRNPSPSPVYISELASACRELTMCYKALEDSDVPFTDTIERFLTQIIDVLPSIILTLHKGDFSALDLPGLIHTMYENKLDIVTYYIGLGYRNIYDG